MAGTNTEVGRTKVAILGGGCGALAAAFELTHPDQCARYDVTIYQQGWRLGGKCASGRDSETHQRILEHGLHMLLGFYHQAFRLMRACYDEWPSTGKAFVKFEDAFEKQNRITFQEQVAEAGALVWKSWNVDVAVRDGLPGDTEPSSGVELVTSFAEWMDRKHCHVKSEQRRLRSLRKALHWLDDTESFLERTWSRLLSPMGKALRLARSLHPDHRCTSPALWLKILGLIELAAVEVRHWEQVTDEELRHDVLLLRLGYASLRGLIADVMLHGGDFSRINHLDFRTWLMKHGARKEDVWSAPVKALYDLGFAYVDGDGKDPAKAQAAAGVALHVSLLLMFDCRGALLWKMKAGAGDTLFTPLYEVLWQRGVRFEFFHRVDKLELSVDHTTIERIKITRQARIGNKSGYEPLVEVPHRDRAAAVRCWPSEPRWEQIVDGREVATRLRADNLSFESFACEESAENRTLSRGTDFDVVVLGIPVGSLPYICEDLIAARPAWKSMVEGIRTVQTQSIQLWMRPNLKGLGWEAGSTVSISYVEPFDAWGEMSHLLPAEDWPDEDRPGSIQYFCNAMETPTGRIKYDPRFGRTQLRAVTANADAFLDSAIGHLWPRVVDANGKLDRGYVLSRYERANFDPSERYVLSVPNSISRRLRPDCSTFANLYLAGDWVEGRVNSGSVEAAMAGGVKAAQAIACHQSTPKSQPDSSLKDLAEAVQRAIA